jgi:Activator of Hsp90 ATPase homolog 1-like protein
MPDTSHDTGQVPCQDGPISAAIPGIAVSAWRSLGVTAWITFGHFDDKAILSWMGDYAMLEAQPGGQFELDINGAPVRGLSLHLDPPHRLLISWSYTGSDRLPPGASTVEVRLTPTAAASGSNSRLRPSMRWCSSSIPRADLAGGVSFSRDHDLQREHQVAIELTVQRVPIALAVLEQD